MSVDCCKDCQMRHSLCHTNCSVYITAVKKHNAEKERIRNEKRNAKDDRLRVIHGIRSSMRKRKSY